MLAHYLSGTIICYLVLHSLTLSTATQNLLVVIGRCTIMFLRIQVLGGGGGGIGGGVRC